MWLTSSKQHRSSEHHSPPRWGPKKHPGQIKIWHSLQWLAAINQAACSQSFCMAGRCDRQRCSPGLASVAGQVCNGF